MNRFKSFIKSTIIGGITVILPIALLVMIFKWLFKITTNLIQPLTNFFTKKVPMQEFLGDAIVIAIILFVCFVVGAVIRTKVGRFLHLSLEENLLKFAPGYNMIKETILQFLGKSKPPFSQVCLVQIFENSTMCTGLIAATHENGYYTVFTPTGPNPTTGIIYHVKKEFVHIVDVPIETAVRTFISCGVGSERVMRGLPPLSDK
ncbi:MAG: hypothetical protein ACD_62C00395G0010 [uncultured bacterium]|nr:MAG: hypothetical protein ACD_62C00395G0010 [uncultured bacterium]